MCVCVCVRERERERDRQRETERERQRESRMEGTELLAQLQSTMHTAVYVIGVPSPTVPQRVIQNDGPGWREAHR